MATTYDFLSHEEPLTAGFIQLHQRETLYAHTVYDTYQSAMNSSETKESYIAIKCQILACSIVLNMTSEFNPSGLVG